MAAKILELHGACLRRTAVTALGEFRVRQALQSGEFASPWPGVLIDSARVTDPLTLAAAATLYAGPTALLAGPTAAHLHGCPAAPMLPVHLAVPYEQHLRSRPGLRIHNGTGLDADGTTLNRLRVLCLERVLVDVLCTARPNDALAVLDQALAQASADQREPLRHGLLDRLLQRPDPRGTRRAARLLEIASERAESPAESWLRWVILDLGFPVPEVNWWIVDINGVRRYRVDLAWPALRIALEYDGYEAHEGRRPEDEARRADVRRRDWIVVVAEEEDLGRPSRLVAELHKAFRDRGVVLRLRVADADGSSRRR